MNVSPAFIFFAMNKMLHWSSFIDNEPKPPLMTSSAFTGEDIPAPGLSTKSLSISPRIHSLDVLRGIAVLAALFVSIWVFGGFGGEQQKELLLRSKGWNYRVFGAIELLFNGKMRGLIALV